MLTCCGAAGALGHLHCTLSMCLSLTGSLSGPRGYLKLKIGMFELKCRES